MIGTYVLNLGISDILALLSALVAGLSALYARWAYGEARRSNEISLSTPRKEIYDAFFELKMYMHEQAESVTLSEISKFYYPARNAKIYFSEDLSSEIEKYFNACFSIAKIKIKNNGNLDKIISECKPHFDMLDELDSKIEKNMLNLIRRVS